MQFDSVELKNFMSYEHAVFDGLDRSGLTLIEGRNLDQGDSNGAGKSTPWDAVSWALFGKTIRGVKDDGVINRKCGENCQVTVNIKQKTYKYAVTRIRKDETLGNKLFVEKKGTITRDIHRIELGTMDATQEWIVKELGIDFDLFRCTVLFGQGETFNFVNESNGDQKKILSKIMKVDFKEQYVKAKDKLKENESSLQKIESNITVLKSHIKDPETEFKEEVEKWEDQRTERAVKVASEVKSLGLRLKAIEDDLKEKPVEKLIATKNKVREKITELQGQSDELGERIAKGRALLENLKEGIRSCESLGSKESCPLCHGEVDRERGLQRIAKSKAEIKTTEQSVAELNGEKTVIETKKRDFSSKLEYLRDKIGEQEGKTRLAKELKEQLIGRQREAEAILDEENPFYEKIKEGVEKQAKIAAKLEELTADIEHIKEDRPYLEFWVRAFGDDGIKSFIFDLICSTLTNRANTYLNTLTGGHIAVQFDTQKKLKSGETREKFECQVITDGKAISYDSYSGGEKRRISLAVDMSLADLMSDYHGSKFNLVVFDEQDQYLDNKGRKHYLELLKGIAKHKRVFVVAHDDQFKAEFDEVITIEKRDGVSRVA